MPNLWFGLTPDCDGKDIIHLRKISAAVLWLSLEPLLKEFELPDEAAEFFARSESKEMKSKRHLLNEAQSTKKT